MHVVPELGLLTFWLEKCDDKGKPSIEEEKKRFFSGLARITHPPPPLPDSGNLVLFFGRQKLRFAGMTDFFYDDNDSCNDIIMMIFMLISMMIMTKITKKHTITVKFE